MSEWCGEVWSQEGRNEGCYCPPYVRFWFLLLSRPHPCRRPRCSRTSTPACRTARPPVYRTTTGHRGRTNCWPWVSSVDLCGYLVGGVRHVPPRLLYTPSCALLDRRASTQIHTSLQVSVGWAATTPSCRRHTSPRALGTRYEHCGCVRWDGSPSWAGPHLLWLPIVTSHNMSYVCPSQPFPSLCPSPPISLLPFPSPHPPL